MSTKVKVFEIRMIKIKLWQTEDAKVKLSLMLIILRVYLVVRILGKKKIKSQKLLTKKHVFYQHFLLCP